MLAELEPGAEAELRMVSDKDPALLRYLTSLGLDVGTRFAVLDRQPFRGPTTIVVPGRGKVVIGHELALMLGCSRAPTPEQA